MRRSKEELADNCEHTEVGVDEVVRMIELHHCVGFTSTVCLDVLFEAPDDEVVVCMVFSLHVSRMVWRHVVVRRRRTSWKITCLF